MDVLQNGRTYNIVKIKDFRRLTATLVIWDIWYCFNKMGDNVFKMKPTEIITCLKQNLMPFIFVQKISLYDFPYTSMFYRTLYDKI